jgi:uncharacterized protein (DUF924 family)
MTSATRPADAPAEPSWVGDVLEFWFGELSIAQWFARDDALDARICERFLALHEWLLAQEGPWAMTARGALAAVIVLDQFSRNLFRDDPRTYAADPLARRISRRAIELGLDAAMTTHERLFLYMPFEHSEDIADQALAVDLISALCDAELTRYAIAHRDIVERFGRFPHRNALLGRASTPGEIAFLQEPMSSF